MSSQSAVSRVREALDEARASQGLINAFTLIDDEAIHEAEQLDERVAEGQVAGLLAGTPVGLKDLIDQKGKETTCGSAFYRQRAVDSASVVNRLEAAGAIIIGRTGLHEWAFGFSSENPHFGPVRNPWDTSTSPGGSSGGSAAAVAAGITPIGVGTDTGGSVRVPAALCGCYGLKTTHGRVPIDGVFPLVASIDTVGPITNSMHSLEIAYRVMADDPAPYPPAPEILRIGIPQPWFDSSPLSDSVAASFGSTMARLEDMGHVVEMVTIPEACPPGHIWAAIAEEVTAVHAEFRAAGKPYGDDVAKRLDSAERVTPAESAEGRLWQERVRTQFADAFRSYDLLATPTVPVMRKVIGEDSMQGAHYRTVLSWFTAIVNHALLPAIALPLKGSGAPPASLQLIGPPDSEPLLIAFGHALEGESIAGFRPAPIDFSSL